ncbi:MAG: DNA polymerase I, partial [Clostridia bacterium]|nr:DNA polymerase I [Clostridia bacterium]
DTEENIIKKVVTCISIIIENKVYYIEDTSNIKKLQEIFENPDIKKIGYKLKEDYILLKQIGITLKGFYYDTEIAGYIIDAVKNKYDLETLSLRYLNLELSQFIGKKKETNKQLDLFSLSEEKDESEKEKACIYVYAINKLYVVTKNKIEEQGSLELFNNIEMPTAEVLAKMQYTGIYIDKEELIEFGRGLKLEIEEKTNKIYRFSGQEFNINSTKQLGKVLFEDLKLPVQKKKKTGYSTDVEVLEKLVDEHPVIREILDYRQLMKLNSTYVEGMIPYINSKTNRIHSYFHQTVTATGRISSAEPNLQNIPTRFELGKNLRKVFKPKERMHFYRC